MRGYPKNPEALDSRDSGQLVRNQFAKRLYNAIMAKGITQSELGRRSGLTRNAISTYIKAKALPTPANLAALAKPLDVAPEELLPPVGEAMSDPILPGDICQFRDVGDGMARLQVSKIVPFETALEVVRLVNNVKAKSAD